MIRTVEEEDENVFNDAVDALLKNGYKILSTFHIHNTYVATLSNEKKRSKKDELLRFLRYIVVNYNIENMDIYDWECGEQYNLEDVVNDYLDKE